MSELIDGMLYFGCWGDKGHYLWRPDGTKTEWFHETILVSTEWPHETALVSRGTPWGDEIDGGLTPKGHRIEGITRLTHKHGWTALAFWDRSVDHRPGSHSTFVAPGTWTAAEMLESARATFPSIWARYKFDVRMEAA